MFRNDSATAVVVLPTPGAVGPHPNGYFFGGDLDAGTLPTPLDFDFLNAMQEEYCYFVEFSGATLSKTDNTQLLTALQTVIGPPGTGFFHIEQDPDPTLANNLDVGSFGIKGDVGNPNIVIAPNGTGIIEFGSTLKYTRIAHSGDLTNYIDGATLTPDGVFFIDWSNGLKIGASTMILDAIWNDGTMANDSATALITQQSAKIYADTNLTFTNNFYMVEGYVFNVTGTKWFYNLAQSSTTPTTDLLYKTFAWKVPQNGTLSNLQVTRWQNVGSTNPSDTYALFSYTSATGITVTIATTGILTTGSDNTHTYHAAAGEYILMKAIIGSGQTRSDVSYTFKFTPD